MALPRPNPWCTRGLSKLRGQGARGPYTRDPTYSLHCSSFFGLPLGILNIDFVKPKNGTTMETIGTIRVCPRAPLSIHRPDTPAGWVAPLIAPIIKEPLTDGEVSPQHRLAFGLQGFRGIGVQHAPSASHLSLRSLNPNPAHQFCTICGRALRGLSEIDVTTSHGH